MKPSPDHRTSFAGPLVGIVLAGVLLGAAGVVVLREVGGVMEPGGAFAEATPAPASGPAAAPQGPPAQGASLATAQAAAKAEAPKPEAAKPAAPAKPASVPAAKAVGAKSPGVQTATQVEERTNYHYNTLGRRDPFQPLIGSFVPEDQGGEPAIDVGAIKVVGIVWGPDTFALAEDARGNSLILRKGDTVMNGVVQELRKDAVVVKITAEGITQSVAIPLTRKEEQSNASR